MECHHLLIKNYDEACFTEDELNVGITHAISTGRHIVVKRFRPQGVIIRNLRSATKGSAAGGKTKSSWRPSGCDKADEYGLTRLQSDI
jgi:hypothetical protein